MNPPGSVARRSTSFSAASATKNQISRIVSSRQPRCVRGSAAFITSFSQLRPSARPSASSPAKIA